MVRWPMPADNDHDDRRGPCERDPSIATPGDGGHRQSHRRQVDKRARRARRDGPCDGRTLVMLRRSDADVEVLVRARRTAGRAITAEACDSRDRPRRRPDARSWPPKSAPPWPAPAPLVANATGGSVCRDGRRQRDHDRPRRQPVETPTVPERCETLRHEPDHHRRGALRGGDRHPPRQPERVRGTEGRDQHQSTGRTATPPPGSTRRSCSPSSSPPSPTSGRAWPSCTASRRSSPGSASWPGSPRSSTPGGRSTCCATGWSTWG
jgi:hypothetical protein